jgi:hypothetical protein
MSETEKTTEKAISVENYIDEKQLGKDLSFSTNDLSAAMMQQSALFVYYGTRASMASRQVNNLEMILEATESTIYRKLRDTYATSGEKVTEKQLEKEVIGDKRVIALKRAVNEAKQVEQIAKIATEGFRHRRDMLVQQGLLSREEMKGDVSIAKRQLSEELTEQQKQDTLDRIAKRRSTES